MSDLFEFLNTMSPEERQRFYKSARQLAEEKAKGEQQAKEAHKAELESLSIEDIDAELSSMKSPRSDPQRWTELTTTRGQKLEELTASLTPPTTMNKSDWDALNTQRDDISNEINQLARSGDRNVVRMRELRAKLAELSTPDPDVVITTEPAKEDEE